MLVSTLELNEQRVTAFLYEMRDVGASQPMEIQGAVEAEGMRCVVTPTVMRGPAEAAALAETVVALTS